jgi:acetylornithine deacetylase/succinyl-diaminopimelate desuccinylase-like protein
MSEVDILRELVSMDSVFPNERRVGERLESALKELGFTVSRQEIPEGRFNVIGERGSRGSPVLFYGHMDTVPVYGEWTSDPFELIESDGRLYGLGAYDMKAGIAAVLSALQEESDRRIKVAFGVDEENNSAGAWELVGSGFLDDVEGVITCEIGDERDEALAGRVITLGRRGRAVFEFRVPGRSIHAAHSRGQASATREAAKLVVALEEMNDELPSHELLPRASQYVSSVESRSTSLSTPAEATVIVDRHLVVPEDVESALRDYEAFLDRLYSEGRLEEIDGRRISVSIKGREQPYLMPYYTPRENGLARSLADAVRSEAGEPHYNTGHSVADECVLASAGVPVVSLAPIGGNEHSADEWVSKRSYLQMIRVLRRFIGSL